MNLEDVLILHILCFKVFFQLHDTALLLQSSLLTFVWIMLIAHFANCTSPSSVTLDLVKEKDKDKDKVKDKEPADNCDTRPWDIIGSSASSLSLIGTNQIVNSKFQIPAVCWSWLRGANVLCRNLMKQILQLKHSATLQLHNDDVEYHQYRVNGP